MFDSRFLWWVLCVLFCFFFFYSTYSRFRAGSPLVPHKLLQHHRCELSASTPQWAKKYHLKSAQSCERCKWEQQQQRYRKQMLWLPAGNSLTVLAKYFRLIRWKKVLQTHTNLSDLNTAALHVVVTMLDHKLQKLWESVVLNLVRTRS